jgi:hypothetical protein
MFLRNVGCYTTDYTASYPIRSYSRVIMFYFYASYFEPSEHILQLSELGMYP